MSSKWVLDIETIPDLEALAGLPDPKPASNLKDPEKIAASIAEKKQAIIDGAALNYKTAKVGFVGLYNGSEFVSFHGDERQVIADTLKFIGERFILTFNGSGFDLPVLYRRAMKHGLPYGIYDLQQRTDRYRPVRHMDLMTAWCGHSPTDRESLATLCRFFGLGDKLEHDHTQTAALLETPEGVQQVADYCKQDCMLTWGLAQRMGVLANDG